MNPAWYLGNSNSEAWPIILEGGAQALPARLPWGMKWLVKWAWPQSGSEVGVGEQSCGGESQYRRQSPTVLSPRPQDSLLRGPMGAI